MTKFLLLIALCAVFAVAILAGSGAAAVRHPAPAPSVHAVTSNGSDNPAPPTAKGSGGGRMHY
jgi:hypothetical protein